MVASAATEMAQALKGESSKRRGAGSRVDEPAYKIAWSLKELLGEFDRMHLWCVAKEESTDWIDAHKESLRTVLRSVKQYDGLFEEPKRYG